MNLPSTITPEVAAFFRMQMTIAAARAVEPLTRHVKATEDFAYGLLRVLGDIVPHLLRTDPELGAAIAEKWQAAADRFERMEAGETVEPGESVDRLEARGQLHRLCTQSKVWPAQRPGMSGTPRKHG